MMRMPYTSINKLHVEDDFETFTRIPTVSDLFNFLFFVFSIFFSFFFFLYSFWLFIPFNLRYFNKSLWQQMKSDTVQKCLIFNHLPS